jgi:hypothetical protein
MSDRAVYAAIWQEQVAFDDDDQDSITAARKLLLHFESAM